MRKKVLTLIMALAMLLSLVPTVLAAEFKDMADVDGWAEEGVGRWGGEGVFNGDQNGNFNPEAGLTRAEAAQVLVNLMHLDGTADLSKFADYETVLKDHWAVPALEAVVAAGILNGDETGLNPEGSVDRQMMFVMIARALGIKPITETEKDIPDIDKADNWASGYIMALVDIGAIHGVDAEGSVDPLTDINRQTTAVLFDQLIGGYGNEDGDKIEIEEGKITLVVADNVTVTGEADPDLPIVVAGEAVKVDASEVTGEAKIAVNVDDAEVAAPEGAVVTPAEGVTGVTVNDEAVEAGEDYTVPEQEETTLPYTPPTTQPSTSEPEETQPTETEETYRIVFDATHGTIKLNELDPEGDSCWGGSNTCYGGVNAEQGTTKWISISVTVKPSELTLEKIAYNNNIFTLTPDTGYSTYKFAGWYHLKTTTSEGEKTQTDYSDQIEQTTPLKDFATDGSEGEKLIVLSAVWKNGDDGLPTCWGGENNSQGYTDGTGDKPGAPASLKITIIFDATLGYISINTNSLNGNTCFGGENTCFGGENTCYGGENGEQSGADWISLTGNKGDASLKLSDLGITSNTFKMEIDDAHKSQDGPGEYAGYTFAGWYVFKDGQYKKADETTQELNLLDYLNGNQVVLYAGWKKEDSGSTCYGGNNDGTGYGSYTDGNPGIPATITD